MLEHQNRLAICLAVLLLLTLAMASWAQDKGHEGTVSLDFRNVDIRTALKTLFNEAGYNYAIDPTVSAVYVNVVLKDVTFETALRVLLKQAGLTFSKEPGEVYIVKPKVQDTITVTEATISETPAEEVKESKTVIEKIPLVFADIYDIVSILGGSVATSRLNSIGSSYGGSSGFGTSGSYGTGSYGANSYGSTGFGTGGFGTNSFGTNSYGTGSYGTTGFGSSSFGTRSW